MAGLDVGSQGLLAALCGRINGSWIYIFGYTKVSCPLPPTYVINALKNCLAEHAHYMLWNNSAPE